MGITARQQIEYRKVSGGLLLFSDFFLVLVSLMRRMVQSGSSDQGLIKGGGLESKLTFTRASTIPRIIVSSIRTL